MPPTRPTQLQGITDLTLFADIKPGLIEGIFDSRSYVWRLERVLTLLDAARRASREADVQPSPFVDAVARFRGIHFFRFAILPSRDRLFLNVTFDGGWEPYLRLIWGPLGTMLDLIFCHCTDYPLAAASSYDDYIRWIRSKEVPSQFFYADSAGSVADRAYLEGLEWQQRRGGERADADRRAAQLKLEAVQSPRPSLAAALPAIRALKGLYGLRQFFGNLPPPGGSVPVDDESVLLRFAQDFLPDLRQWVDNGWFNAGGQFDALQSQVASELKWLTTSHLKRPERRDKLSPLKPDDIQAGILKSLKPPAGSYVRGALVLARVIDPALARKWLTSAKLISDGTNADLASDRVVCTVAITYSGLKELGVHERRLAMLPGEFAQGMEARAGILGDLHRNHPQQWNRPQSSQGTSINLELVHILIQLRTCETDTWWRTDRSGLLPRLSDWIDENLVKATFETLAVEPSWSPRPEGNEPAARDHFGYADGISQPNALAASAANQFWDEGVKMGELLLGWVNERGDGPLKGVQPPLPSAYSPSPDWLDNGTYLVVRKIRQHVERFDTIVDKSADALVAAGIEQSRDKARELVRAKLMGRASSGEPLVQPRGGGANDFNFRSDADGAQCPFASHVRRANPRQPLEGGGRPPRIARRGMRYGPPPDQPNPSDQDEAPRGVLFMAYNASIAEQFEVIQRWMTGGNSSGVSSSQPDPFLGVPRAGEPNVFRFTHDDKVVRVDLGDQPICQLEWGLYAFVPSMAQLSTFDSLVASPPAQSSLPSPTLPETKNDAAEELKKKVSEFKKKVKVQFEDELVRGESWAEVRHKHRGVKSIGDEATGRRVMVGGLEPMMEVLKDNGSTYSVCGYGKRMKETLGPSPFGQDDAGPNLGHARPFVSCVKTAVAEAVDEKTACDTAHAFVAAWLRARIDGSKKQGLPVATVDLIELGTSLIAELLSTWFGVNYADGLTVRGGLGADISPVRCPGHFLSVARKVFSADPNDTVEALAVPQGQALTPLVKECINSAEAAPLLKAVLEAIPTEIADDEKSGTVANVMLGLPATLLGSWGKILRAWVTDRRLWKLQHELRQTNVGDGLHRRANKALRDEMIATMVADPVADGIWRTVTTENKDVQLAGVKVYNGDIVWLGLGSALLNSDPKSVEAWLFGGENTSHACPGRYIAIGTLLGALAALLEAGELAPVAANPLALTLRAVKEPGS